MPKNVVLIAALAVALGACSSLPSSGSRTLIVAPAAVMVLTKHGSLSEPAGQR